MRYTPEKKDWFTKFVKGNSKALNYYFEQYNKLLFYSAFRLIGETEQAEEIVSDSFQSLWQCRSKINSEEHLKAFLLTATRNGCYNYLKSLQRRTAARQELIKDQLSREESDNENQELEAELMGRVHKALERLPGKCKTIFELIYFENYSTKEVAEKLRIMERNVLNQKSRAIQLLRNILS